MIKRWASLSWCFTCLFLLIAPPWVAAQPPPSEEILRASNLRKERKYPEALIVLQGWLSAHHDEPEGLFEYGYTLYLQAAAEGDSDAGNALRKTARDFFVRAQKGGSTSVLLDGLLAGIDGKTGKVGGHFSTHQDVDALMKQGEKAFAAGRFDEAFSCYQKTLALDPRMYMAALFSGDAFFSQNKLDDAIKWFDRAILISPQVETAHRYKADALRKKGVMDQAMNEYIEATVAEPTNRLPREMLRKLAAASKRTIHHPKFDMPIFAVEAKDIKKIDLHYDPKYGPAALGYAMSRAQWLSEERSKYFSADAKPRHSLPEEVYGLRHFVAIWQELGQKQLEGENAQWAESVAELKKLDDAGLLEAYVLFDRSDAGIAQDYEGYRLEHHDLLARYIREIWMEL